MKFKILAAVTSVAVAMMVASAANAGNQSEKIEFYKKTLKNVPAVELPEKASAEVKKVKKEDQTETAIAVLRATMEISPASTPAVVGAISRVAPHVARALVDVTAKTSPKQAGAALQAARSSIAPAAVSVTPNPNPWVSDGGPAIDRTQMAAPPSGPRQYDRP